MVSRLSAGRRIEVRRIGPTSVFSAENSTVREISRQGPSPLKDGGVLRKGLASAGLYAKLGTAVLLT